MMYSKNFDYYWDLSLPWFEPPNHHRGGWSGVVFYEDKDFGPVFIKKQAQYTKRTWRHPWRGELTVSYEKKNIERLERCNVNTLRIRYFETTPAQRGILMTEALSEHQPLDEWLKTHDINTAVTDALLSLLTKLHRNHLAHCALYPKHIFIKSKGSIDLRLIDLEKMRFKPFRFWCALHDLNKLNRHLVTVSTKARLRFLKKYLESMGWCRFYRYFRTYFLLKFRKP